MDMYSQAAWIIPLLPLAAFLVLAALGRGFRRSGVLIGSVASLSAFVMSLLVLLERLKPNAVDYNNSFDWIVIGRYTLSIGYEVTNLTALMLVVVTLVSFLVNVYSAGYMKDDERITVFYGYVSLFTFSMLGLVISDNLLSLYIFWELVGVCSFLLIGFWYTKPAARAAAKKAFIVTRVGDAGLLLAILLLFWHMPDHSLGFTMIKSVFDGQAGSIAEGVTTLIALLIFLGAVGKSGQFPLHIWLPDAMEGPTPISALIHAATMVAAGVFLIARTFDIFEASAAAMETVAYIGGFTAIFAATIALAQNDIKRILAYSTISQLGYMMLAIGLGSWTGGIFHLFTHAFFKALLFLGAGSIIHAVHTQNIHEMGGLGPRMRTTAWTFAIGALALAGIPPLSGFWSKDAILTVAFENSPVLFVVGLAAAFCTALYMSRLFILVFMGKPRNHASSVRQPSAAMTTPLIILAVLTVGAGFVETPWNGWLGSWLSGESPNSHGNLMVIISSIAVGVLGIMLGWLIYSKGVENRAADHGQGSWIVRTVERGYYIDELFVLIILKPLRAIGAVLAAFDAYVISGVVRLIAAAAGSAGKAATRLQNGQVQTYGLAAVIGSILIAIVIIGRRFLG